MLGRLFLLLVLLAVSFYGVKFIREKLNKQHKNTNREPNNNDKDSTDKNPNLVVKCQHCGLHIPEKEAIKKGDNTFCSLEHAKKEL